MKKLLLATAVAAVSVSAAHAAPTVYGKAFVTADYNDFSGDVTRYYSDGTSEKGKVDSQNTSLNSTGSRIGLKGAEALTANTDLVYQLEYGIEIDDANGGTNKGKKQDQFYSRDTYLGLSNKQYGTALAGRLTAIDDMINYTNQAVGGVVGGDDVLATVTAPRANNALAYVSPSYNGLNFLGMYVMDEGVNSASSDLGVTNDIWGIGAKYEPAGRPFRLGATYLKSGDFKDARISGAFDLNAATTIGALYQNTDFGGGDNENAYTLSGAYKTATPWTVYAQGDYVDHAAGVSDAKRQRYILGGKYAFNAATTGHIYGAYLNNDHTVSNYQEYTDGTSSIDVDNYDGFGIGAGIEYKF